MIASTTASQALFLPPATAAEIYRDPSVVAGGVFAPNGAGAVAGDTVTVTGRWQWGSGTQHCQWILGGTRVRRRHVPAVLVRGRRRHVPRHVVHVGPARHGVAGLLRRRRRRAARPHDPAVRLGPATIDVPLARFPNFSLLAAGVAAVSLGHRPAGARRARSPWPRASGRCSRRRRWPRARTRRSSWPAPRPRCGRPGRSCTTRSAGRGTPRRRRRPRSACRPGSGSASPASTPRRAAAEVADTAFTLAGGSSVYSTNVLQRCQRDAHIPTQHLQVAPKLYETLGRLLLDQPADTATL